jgi:hypothetical protein
MKNENLKLRSGARLQSLAGALLAAQRFNLRFSICCNLQFFNSQFTPLDSWIT